MKCSRAPLALQLAGLSPLTATQRKRDDASETRRSPSPADRACAWEHRSRRGGL